jgi:C4-dicarboxylate transporter
LKFAQAVGFVFAVVAAAGFATGLTVLGLVATAFALIAAFLNAAFGICLGCQLYPLVARLRRVPSPS